MAVAGIQGILDLYTLQADFLTKDVTDIQMQITRATRSGSQYANDISKQKEKVSDKYEAGSTAYENAIDKINTKYDVKMAELNAWESELNSQKSEKETQLQEISSYKESYQSVLKNNIKSSFTYGQKSS